MSPFDIRKKEKFQSAWLVFHSQLIWNQIALSSSVKTFCFIQGVTTVRVGQDYPITKSFKLVRVHMPRVKTAIMPPFLSFLKSKRRKSRIQNPSRNGINWWGSLRSLKEQKKKEWKKKVGISQFILIKGWNESLGHILSNKPSVYTSHRVSQWV